MGEWKTLRTYSDTELLDAVITATIRSVYGPKTLFDDTEIVDAF